MVNVDETLSVSGKENELTYTAVIGGLLK